MPPPFSFPPPLQPYDKSDYQIIKEGDWNNMHDFMSSYDLKAWGQSDYEMTKQILEGFREVDQQAWEEQYGYHGELEQDYHRDNH
ncbi:uncharacterized protein ACHE_30340A [Aspergillus chevalieri]|uniref:Uncharacterized protein n=1 Tax=Aspergillus chevalieri TaxID=182096 RepID=A0A7R7VKF8_ASPCH|nr:uncharacterized protein ACHE_30340A [Aspergillus chevalieri]BCR86353.1 hypothetical protein ACHE_30340A [Aspergillus chevalieri]